MSTNKGVFFGNDSTTRSGTQYGVGTPTIGYTHSSNPESATYYNRDPNYKSHSRGPYKNNQGQGWRVWINTKRNEWAGGKKRRTRKNNGKRKTCKSRKKKS